MPSVEGLPARRAALQLLDSVLRRGKTLDAAAGSVRGLSPPDRALAVAIAGEALRRLPDLDSLIDGATRNRLPDDSKARMVLRLALAQKVGLGTPEHALVSTALPLVDGGPRRLVHGVLGTLLRRGVPAMDAPSLPPAVEQRWRAAWGDATVEAARRQIGHRPALDLTFGDDAEAEAYAAANDGVSLAPRHVRLASSAVAELSGFEGGRWWVQDLAASLPARLIPGDVKSALDLCAAPGGKTMQLAAAGHQVTAVDSSAARLGAAEREFRAHPPRREFDRRRCADVEAQGAVRRHPTRCALLGNWDLPPPSRGALPRQTAQIIAESADLQRQLLARAANWLKPGGALVYSVCSLESDEGEAVIRDFLGQS